MDWITFIYYDDVIQVKDLYYYGRDVFNFNLFDNIDHDYNLDFTEAVRINVKKNWKKVICVHIYCNNIIRFDNELLGKI